MAPASSRSFRRRRRWGKVSRRRSRSLRSMSSGCRSSRCASCSGTPVADATWPNGCHVCEVEVDPQTGAVEIDRYWSVNDVGRVVNPMIVKGQLEGGALQGIGQALCERFVYDAESGQPLSPSFMDYAL